MGNNIEKLISIKNTLDKNRKIITGHKYIDAEGVEIQIDSQVFSPELFEDSVFFTKNIGNVHDLDILEIGAGTGYFSIKLALNGAKSVVATDNSRSAYLNALKNIKNLGLKDIVDLRLGNVFEPVRKNEKFDLIFWNIPFCYIDDTILKEIGIQKPIDELEETVFNFEYKLLKEYLKGGFKCLKKNGKLLLGFSPSIGSFKMFSKIITELGLTYNVIIEKDIEMSGNLETLQIIQFYH